LNHLNAQGSKDLLQEFSPEDRELPAVVRSLRVAAIGGGTGLSTLLRGL
jgi:hypothetical protein